MGSMGSGFAIASSTMAASIAEAVMVRSGRAGSVGNEPIAGNSPIGGFQPHKAAKGGGLPDGTACISSQRISGQPRRHSCCRAT